MCLLITLIAAIASTVAWRLLASRPNWKLRTLCLMYWGATLMWLADGFFRLKDGEPFFDLSASDAWLGLLIVGCGLIAWLLVLLFDRQRKALPSGQRAKD